MFDIKKVPEKISKKIAGLSWTSDNVGMSTASIFMFDEMVLNVEKISRSSKHENQLLGWLDGKLPVPKIIEATIQDDYSFLLGRVPTIKI